MAGRIRTIKPELLEDEKAASLSDAAWRLFVSLWVLCDDYGNTRAGTKYLATMVWQDTSKEERARAALAELAAMGRILLYEVNGDRYLSIPSWAKHQRVDNAGKPRVPGPPAYTTLTASALAETRGDSRRLAALPPTSDLRPPTSNTDHKDPRSGDPSEPAGSASPHGPDAEASPALPTPSSPAEDEPTVAATGEADQAASEATDDSEVMFAPPEPAEGHPRASNTAPAPEPLALFALEPVAPEPAKVTDIALEVFEHYLVGWHRHVRGNRPPKFDEKRRKLVAKRLKEGWLVEELKRACDGLWCSEWHLQEKRTDFDLVMRDTPHVEQFLAKLPAAPPRPAATSLVDSPPRPDPRIFSVELPPEAKTPDGARKHIISVVQNYGLME